jgi:hypothetical protein
MFHVLSSKNDDVIQTLAPYAANESFTNGINQGRPNRRTQYFHPCSFRNAIELSPELVVVIANDELGSLTERRDVAELLRRPFRGGRTSDANVHNALRIYVDHEERKDRPKPDVISLQEIAGPDCMVSQKCAPSLAARESRWSDFGHVSLDCPFRNSDTELQQFAAYSFRSPQDIFSGHAVDERDDFRVNSRSTAFGIFRLPTPEEPKSLAVPTEHRVWFHE